MNTDKKAGAVKPLGDILYGERVHAGMYQGLFEPFLPEFKQGAFGEYMSYLFELTGKQTLITYYQKLYFKILSSSQKISRAQRKHRFRFM